MIAVVAEHDIAAAVADLLATLDTADLSDPSPHSVHSRSHSHSTDVHLRSLISISIPSLSPSLPVRSTLIELP